MQGVIRQITAKERSYYTVAAVMEIFGIGKDKAYKMIRATRADLIREGKLYSDYPSGKVPKVAFNRRYML